MSRGFPLLILLFPLFFFANNKVEPTYDIIRENYQDLLKNNERALPYVKLYIKKAKKEKDFEHLTQGYRDAVFFSKNEYTKLSYSDSMIYAALKSRDNDLISLAYLGKGIIYYFNFKKFEPALDEYIKAYEYSKNTKDDYLKYKVIYHMAVVKSYLGYYTEASIQFNQCMTFFESQTKKNLHYNEIFNNYRGYFKQYSKDVGIIIFGSCKLIVKFIS